MSIRTDYADRFGEQAASALEAAAVEHSNGINSERRGADPFVWACLIAVGYQCVEVDRYREHHGIDAPTFEEFRSWCREHGEAFRNHVGDCDYLALMAGTYQEFMGWTEAQDAPSLDVATGRGVG